MGIIIEMLYPHALQSLCMALMNVIIIIVVLTVKHPMSVTNYFFQPSTNFPLPIITARDAITAGIIIIMKL